MVHPSWAEHSRLPNLRKIDPIRACRERRSWLGKHPVDDERALVRMLSISFCAAEAYHLARSMLSKAAMMNRLGGAPSSAAMFSVCTMVCPLKAALDAAVFGRRVLSSLGTCREEAG